jgi:hypothetical protein
MHPELLSSLATEHRRDLAASVTPHLVTGDPDHPARRPGVRNPGVRYPGVRYPRAGRVLPRLRVSWSRTTLAAAAGRERGRSLVIVISATRTL